MISSSKAEKKASNDFRTIDEGISGRGEDTKTIAMEIEKLAITTKKLKKGLDFSSQTCRRRL